LPNRAWPIGRIRVAREYYIDAVHRIT
jgi:hypothetical protein